VSESLTGVWYGRYSAVTHHEINSFIAVIDDWSGTLVGAITEPEDIGFDGIRRATVSGRRSGAQVDFVKQYDGAVYDHAVHYSGTVNDDATEIGGSWEVPGSGRGGFVMTREKFTVEELEGEIEVREELP
jgi:hypothetical protein